VIAALAMEAGATVVSYDRDFTRFAGLSWRTPDPSGEPPTAAGA
jgi:predicted nucleic acid-binding protein